MSTNPLIYLIAGEASGDLLGGRLMKALKQQTDTVLSFAGIGGATMMEEGLNPLFPMAELSIMGLVEVLSHAPRLIRRIDQTAEDIVKKNPAIVVTIDAPDFSFRVAKKIAKRNPEIKLVHYVAPTVWAWRPGRAKKIARFLDRLLALFPFEPPYFHRVGLQCDFVGHPAIENALIGHGDRFKRSHGMKPDIPILALLPGSRMGEVKRLLPLFLDVAQTLKQHVGEIYVVLPTVPHLAATIKDSLRDFPLPYFIVEGADNKADAFAASHAALAASGTVAVELGLARVPAVIAYRANPLTACLARKLVKLRYVSLVNILLGSEIMPEFLQDSATAPLITPALERIFSDTPERRLQLEAANRLVNLLKPDDLEPSQKAAEIVLSMFRE